MTLVLRAERVAAIEAERIFGATGGGGGGGDTTRVQSHRPLARSLTGATSPTVAVPGLALAEDRTIVDDVAESAGTGVATVTDLRTPRRKRLVSVISVARRSRVSWDSC